MRHATWHIAIVSFVLLLLGAPVFGQQDDPEMVKGVQQALIDRGYDVGPVDGVLGPRTRAELGKFQRDEGLYVSEDIDWPTLQRLLQSNQRRRPVRDGARTVGQTTASGATTAGQAVAGGATTAGKTTASGAKTAGRATASGAETAGQATAQGARATGKATVKAAQTSGSAARQGTEKAGRATGNALETAGEATASGLSTAGRATATGLKGAGRAVASAFESGHTRRTREIREVAAEETGLSIQEIHVDLDGGKVTILLDQATDEQIRRVTERVKQIEGIDEVEVRRK